MGCDVRARRFSVTLLFLSLIGIGTLCGCFQWKSQADPILFACKGKPRVIFPWKFNTGENETVEQIKWIFDSGNNSALVGSYSRKLFLTNPKYSKRVRHLAPGGLTLRGVKVNDAGNYSIEVTVENKQKSCRKTHTQTLTLQVGEGVMMEGGQLKARQAPVAVWEEETQQWFIYLTCGHFTFWGTPPEGLHVIWTMPSGDTHMTKDYQDGDFLLKLNPSILQSGVYSCEVPAGALADMCYNASPLGGESVQSNVTVDGMKARMSVAEASNQALLEENRRLRDRLDHVEAVHAEQIANVTRVVSGTFQRQIERLQRSHKSLEDDVHEMWDKARDYDASLSYPCGIGFHEVIDDPARSVSYGDGSLCDTNLKSGWYRFLMDGTDAVLPTSCVPKHQCNTDASTWLDLKGKPLPKVGEEIEAHACAHWNRNCCKWKQPIRVHNCGDFYLYHITPFSDCTQAFCLEMLDK